MKAPVKRIKPKYYYSPTWQSGSVARFDKPEDDAKWFDKDATKKWIYSRYMPWSFIGLLNYYKDMREIPATKKILKGDFSEANGLWKKAKPMKLTK